MLSNDLKQKVDDILSNLPLETTEAVIPLEDETFKDLSVYVGKEPKVTVEIIDVGRKIYVGKDA